MSLPMEVKNQTFTINQVEDWLEEYGDRLFLFARQQTQSYADAQDVYQDGLIAVLEKARKLSGVIPPQGVFYKAIKNKAIDLHRATKRRVARENKVVEMNPRGTEGWFDGLEMQEKNSEISKSIKDLPKEQQEVLILKVWGEETFQSIADVLGISINTASSRYRYAINHLRQNTRLKSIQ